MKIYAKIEYLNFMLWEVSLPYYFIGFLFLFMARIDSIFLLFSILASIVSILFNIIRLYFKSSSTAFL